MDEYIHISIYVYMETIHNSKITLCTVKAGFKIYRVQPSFVEKNNFKTVPYS